MTVCPDPEPAVAEVTLQLPPVGQVISPVVMLLKSKPLLAVESAVSGAPSFQFEAGSSMVKIKSPPDGITLVVVKVIVKVPDWVA